MITRRTLLKVSALLSLSYYKSSISAMVNFHKPIEEISCNDVESIKKLKLKDGMIIRTSGYYHAQDDGAMTYIVKKRLTSNDKYCIKINDHYYIIPLIKDFISFKQLGLKMDGHHDNTDDLRKILSISGKYFFNPGILIVKDYIELNSDITIIGSGMQTSIIEYRNSKNNWLFINGEKGNLDFLEGNGYNGRGNFVLSKFSINLRGDIAEGSRSAMIFGRAKNILIDQVHFYNGKDSHRIECNSQLNFTVRSCIFSNTVISQDGSHEEINIDFNNHAGFPAYGNWDNTPCLNVNIVSCKFINVQKGVASHSTPPKHHSNINVIDCSFQNTTSHAIQFEGIDNSTINNCHFLDSGESDISLINSNKNNIINIKSNNKTTITSNKNSHGNNSIY
jgi:hypothetical protein